VLDWPTIVNAKIKLLNPGIDWPTYVLPKSNLLILESSAESDETVNLLDYGCVMYAKSVVVDDNLFFIFRYCETN